MTMPDGHSGNAKLILVYNADEGLLAMIRDGVHKIFRPETYPCSLCMISYGAVSMRRAWRKYLNSLPYEKHYYHRQDFKRGYAKAAETALPVILIEKDGKLRELLTKRELDRIGDVNALIAATENALTRR